MTVDVSAVEALGYTVEVKTDPGGENIPYIVRGQRGSEYGLCRTRPMPEHLFAVNLRRFGSRARIRGYEWFTDKGGVLRPMH